MINLISSGGQIQFTSHLFAGPAQKKSFIPSLIWGSTPTVQFEPGNINTVVWHSTKEGQHQIWALVESRIQKWDLSDEGWETSVLEFDIKDTVNVAMRITDSDAVDLEMIDLVVQEDGDLIALVSYAISAGETGSSFVGPKRSYYLVRLSHTMEDELEARSCQPIPYQSVSLQLKLVTISHQVQTLSSAAPVHPRMRLAPLGGLVTIQFGDVLVICSLSKTLRLSTKVLSHS